MICEKKRRRELLRPLFTKELSIFTPFFVLSFNQNPAVWCLQWVKGGGIYFGRCSPNCVSVGNFICQILWSDFNCPSEWQIRWYSLSIRLEFNQIHWTHTTKLSASLKLEQRSESFVILARLSWYEDIAKHPQWVKWHLKRCSWMDHVSGMTHPDPGIHGWDATSV